MHQSPDSLRNNVLLGFYGDGVEHEGVNAKFCEHIIHHCKKMMNEFIKNDSELVGTVDQLQFKKDLDQISITNAQKYTIVESHDCQHDDIEDLINSIFVEN